MVDLITELQRVSRCVFKDGWESSDLHARAGLEIARLRARIAELEGIPPVDHLVGLEKVLAMAEAGFALAQYASYAEIVGALSMNRQQVREGCDEIFKLNAELEGDLDAAEAPMFSDDGLWNNLVARFRAALKPEGAE